MFSEPDGCDGQSGSHPDHQSPLRHRERIIELARGLSLDARAMEALAEGYVTSGISPTEDEGYRQAQHNLLSIEMAFETIGEMFERISQFRRGLETRLRNTVRYAEQGDRGLVVRAEEIVRQLERLLAADPDRYTARTVPSPLQKPSLPLSEQLFAVRRQPRQPIVVTALSKRALDPLYLMRKKLKGEFMARMNPAPAAVYDYLSTLLPEPGSIEARVVEITSIDEFLAFDAARRLAVCEALPLAFADQFAVELLRDSSPHDGEWLRCTNFVIHRLAKDQSHAE